MAGERSRDMDGERRIWLVTNDASGRDVQVDYIQVNGQTRQSENQSYNTGVYANGSCGGGSNSEWMHCNGAIGYGNTP